MVWTLDVDLGALDPVVRVLPFILGLLIVGFTFSSLVRTMVIPRDRISSLYAVIIRSTDVAFRLLMRMRRNFTARDRVLAWSGVMGIILALIVWLVSFMLGYGLMIYGVSQGGAIDSLLQAGSGLFTLGVMGQPTGSVTAVDFLAAMTGPVVIALLIGFLPTLYSTYLAREDQVLVSSAVTGAPAWGPEMLSRAQLIGGEQNLPDLYQQWVDWTSQVRLAQSLYPALNRFRSPVESRNWLISLLATMDSAALRLAMQKANPDVRTVAVLEQGAQTILSLYATEVEIKQALPFRRWRQRLEVTLSIFGVSTHRGASTQKFTGPSAGLSPNTVAVAKALSIDNLRGRLADTRGLFDQYATQLSTITRKEFDHALDLMKRAGVQMDRDPDEAFEIFRHERGRYESAAYHLAQILYVVRAPWTGDREPATPVLWPTLAVDQLSD
ncbi:MAG: hypothetical protein VW082_02585 [Candidatus Nanopelagicales bacterium]|jgi:hypothetical protein